MDTLSDAARRQFEQGVAATGPQVEKAAVTAKDQINKLQETAQSAIDDANASAQQTNEATDPKGSREATA